MSYKAAFGRKEDVMGFNPAYVGDNLDGTYTTLVWRKSAYEPVYSFDSEEDAKEWAAWENRKKVVYMKKNGYWKPQFHKWWGKPEDEPQEDSDPEPEPHPTRGERWRFELWGNGGRKYITNRGDNRNNDQEELSRQRDKQVEAARKAGTPTRRANGRSRATRYG